MVKGCHLVFFIIFASNNQKHDKIITDNNTFASLF